MCFEDYGSPEFAESRVVKARKPHKCTECRVIIARGDEYHYYAGKYDGAFFVEKVCRRCDYDRVRVAEHELHEGCDWGEAWPPLGELVSHLIDSDMGQTKPEDVPESFRVGDMPKSPVETKA